MNHYTHIFTDTYFLKFLKHDIASVVAKGEFSFDNFSSDKSSSTKTSGKMRSSSNQSYRIVAIPGEGIGPEVVEASLQLLQQVAKLEGFTLQVDYGWLGKTA